MPQHHNDESCKYLIPGLLSPGAVVAQLGSNGLKLHQTSWGGRKKIGSSGVLALPGLTSGFRDCLLIFLMTQRRDFATVIDFQPVCRPPAQSRYCGFHGGKNLPTFEVKLVDLFFGGSKGGHSVHSGAMRSSEQPLARHAPLGGSLSVVGQLAGHCRS